MPMIDLPSHPVHYRIDGDHGPWLIFCNSLGTDLTMWDAQAAALSDRFRILRYDRRGHGQSGVPPGPYTLADLGGDVIRLMDGLGIAQAHFCGLSIGGLVGQWLGLHAPARIDRLALCATAARIGTAGSWQARITAVQDGGLQPLLAATAERWFTPGFATRQPATVDAILHRFAQTPVAGYAGCCAALAGADLRHRLAAIPHPVLAIAGADDPVCPPSDLAFIAGNVPQGRLLTLPGRHILNVESAVAFNAALAGFLTDAAPAPA